MQKYLVHLRFGRHNLQTFHKRNSKTRRTGTLRSAQRPTEHAACSSVEMNLGRQRQGAALNWEGLAAAATKGSSPSASLQRTGSPCPGEGGAGEHSCGLKWQALCSAQLCQHFMNPRKCGGRSPQSHRNVQMWKTIRLPYPGLRVKLVFTKEVCKTRVQLPCVPRLQVSEDKPRLFLLL